MRKQGRREERTDSTQRTRRGELFPPLALPLSDCRLGAGLSFGRGVWVTPTSSFPEFTGRQALPSVRESWRAPCEGKLGASKRHSRLPAPQPLVAQPVPGTNPALLFPWWLTGVRPPAGLFKMMQTLAAGSSAFLGSSQAQLRASQVRRYVAARRPGCSRAAHFPARGALLPGVS